jgi:RNA polymerase sigma-70 factor, ECF subfamily
MSTTTIPPFWADPDAQLMLSAGRGDASGLAQLIEKYYGAVLRYCFHRVRDFAAAEELTQEVFLRVHGSRLRYRPSARFTTWLYRIASNVVLNWIRDTGRERGHQRLDAARPRGPELQLPDGSPRIDEWLARQSRADELRRAIGELPERQRTAVILHAFEEMPGQEIAHSLGCSHQAVRSLLFRAYATLRTRLNGTRAAA